MTSQGRLGFGLAAAGLLGAAALGWRAWHEARSTQPASANARPAGVAPVVEPPPVPAPTAVPSKETGAAPNAMESAPASTPPVAASQPGAPGQNPGDAAGAETAPPATNPPPPIPTGQWVAIGQDGGFQVHSWSLEPVAAGLRPPASIMNEKWRDAALTRTGGAAILRDSSVAVWHVDSPDEAYHFTLPEGAGSLQATPDEVVARGRNGTAYLLPSKRPEKTRLLAGQVTTLHASAVPGRMPASTESSQILVLHLTGAGSQPPVTTLWRSWHDSVAMTADRKIWAMSTQAGLWMLEPGTAEFKPADKRSMELAPMGSGLLGLLNAGTVVTLNGASPPPQSTQAQRILGVEGMAVAVAEDGDMVLWGPRVPDSPRQTHLPKGAWEVRLGPSGLMVAW